ncbi:uncharacterized protein LOC143301301 isoform X1 [Babylonia areolata]|uniref:uncharacterized protein LOC143301301 isoform X1 n=1 Tax=Babylonia areolata TaxID=304850 RepID=UPI003FD387C2
MQRLAVSFLASLFVTLLLVSTVLASPVLDEGSSRNKRQSADVKTAEYLAWIALGGRVPPQGCFDVACGVVDVYSSGKKKRDYGDEQRYQLLRSLIERAADNNVVQN